MTYWILVETWTTGGVNYYWAQGYLDLCSGRISLPTADIERSGL